MEKLEKDYNMFDWWKKVYIKNYANFNGRARRAEYWYAYLLTILFIIPIYVFLIIAVVSESTPLIVVSGILMGLAVLLMIVPTLAVTVRRLHDTNKSGWYYLLAFIPLVSIIIFVFMVIEGDKNENNYGLDPKNIVPNEELNQIGIEQL